jgi:hypothetical protein
MAYLQIEGHEAPNSHILINLLILLIYNRKRVGSQIIGTVLKKTHSVYNWLIDATLFLYWIEIEKTSGKGMHLPFDYPV